MIYTVILKRAPHIADAGNLYTTHVDGDSPGVIEELTRSGLATRAEHIRAVARFATIKAAIQDNVDGPEPEDYEVCGVFEGELFDQFPDL